VIRSLRVSDVPKTELREGEKLRHGGQLPLGRDFNVARASRAWVG
jgi:hypothetical protein